MGNKTKLQLWTDLAIDLKVTISTDGDKATISVLGTQE